MRKDGPVVLGMVRMSDGAWVLPPIKCKEYAQDTIATKHLGKQKAAFGYYPDVDALKNQRLALVFGAYTEMGMTSIIEALLRKGEALFHYLTDNAFNPCVYGTTPATFYAPVWAGSDSKPAQFDGLVIEYDERIEHHPMLFGTFLACLRAGGGFFPLTKEEQRSRVVRSTHYQPGLALVEQDYRLLAEEETRLSLVPALARAALSKGPKVCYAHVSEMLPNWHAGTGFASLKKEAIPQ
jgi:hypothetical protein